MSNRINSLTVSFEKPIKEEEAESIMSAIMMIKGVSGVGCNIDDVSRFVAETNAKIKLTDYLWKFINELNLTK